MRSIGSTRFSTVTALGGKLAAPAAATGVAFGAWLQHGAAISLPMAEAGLAWCL